MHYWHTQRFVRKNWPAHSVVNLIKDEIKEEKG